MYYSLSADDWNTNASTNYWKEYGFNSKHIHCTEFSWFLEEIIGDGLFIIAFYLLQNMYSPGKICFKLLHSLYHIHFTPAGTVCSSSEYTTLLYIGLPSNIEKKMLACIRFYYMCSVTFHIIVCLI